LNQILRRQTFFTVFRLLTDFVCLYIYEFGLSLCKIVRSSVILLLPLFILSCCSVVTEYKFHHNVCSSKILLCRKSYKNFCFYAEVNFCLRFRKERQLDWMRLDSALKKNRPLQSVDFFLLPSVCAAMFVKKSLVHILYHKEIADARI
jgi:hypothetical protein